MKKNKCNHYYEFTDKWVDKGITYWEFYCKNCCEINTRTDKKK